MKPIPLTKRKTIYKKLREIYSSADKKLFEGDYKTAYVFSKEFGFCCNIENTMSQLGLTFEKYMEKTDKATKRKTMKLNIFPELAKHRPKGRNDSSKKGWFSWDTDGAETRLQIITEICKKLKI